MSRRAVLRGLGGVAIGLPFLEYFGGNAEASTSPKRIVFIVTRNGTDPRTHWPTGTTTNFTLGSVMAPLAAYKNNLVVLRGVDNKAAMATHINGHTDAVRCMLTGRIASNTLNSDYSAAGGISVDQFIANQIGSTTKFKSIEYQTLYEYSNPTNFVCFYDANQPIPFEDETDKLFTRIFGGYTANPDDPAAVAQRADRQSVLHAAYDSYALLNKKLGSADRQRLDAHLQMVHELEAQVTNVSSVACTVPPAPSGMPQNDFVAGIGIVANALSCDLMRVATIAVKQYGFGFLGVPGNYHDDWLHHVMDPSVPLAPQYVNTVKPWECGVVKTLCDTLRAIPDGTGTLFDNTLVVWTDEFCHGYAHTHDEVPYVLLSGSNRFTQMARFLQYTTPVSNNRLWNSLVAMMDATGDFGDPQFDNTPLSELV